MALPLVLSRSAFLSDLNKDIESILITFMEDTNLGRGMTQIHDTHVP